MLIVLRALVVTLSVVLASTVSVDIGIALFGEEPMPSAFWLSRIIPLVIGFPVAYYFFKKEDQIARLNGSLLDAYRNLSTLHAQLSETASRDGMTGILNRSAFMSRVDEIRTNHRNGTLLLVDADHFKSINDQFGHGAGDAALMAIVGAIRAQLRSQDIVGRLGGEEFGVFLVNASRDESLVIAERIRSAVQDIEFCPEPGKCHALSVSIGGATSLQADTLHAAMGLVDRLLYRAKSQGRNCVVLEAA